MGMPEILINFETLGTTAIKRSQKGIVAIILKNKKEVSEETEKKVIVKEYKISTDIKEEDGWDETNLDYIKKTFLGIPSKVICVDIGINGAVKDALNILSINKFNYLAMPKASEDDIETIVTWIKAKRTMERKTYKAVVSNFVADSEGIINFTTDKIKTKNKIYNTTEYCTRIAGICAGLPFTRSTTYFILPEVISVEEKEDKDKCIDAGELILFNDGEKVKIARGVNSLTSYTPKQGKEFSKIKIVEGKDMIHDDIRKTFEDEYVGKVNNSYDNQILFIGAINGYFKKLAKDEIVAQGTKADINVEAKKIYLQSKGIDIDVLQEAQLRRYPTKSNVFVFAKGSILDAMEDLDFSMILE